MFVDYYYFLNNSTVLLEKRLFLEILLGCRFYLPGVRAQESQGLENFSM